MRVIDVDLPKKHDIVLGGDDHLGAITCAEECVKDRYDWVRRSDRRFQVHMGDLAENITPRDKRFNPEVHFMTVSEQYKRVRELLEPVADSTLAVLAGNHDLKNQGRDGDLVRDHVCDPLGITYGTVECKLNVHVRGDLAYKVYLNHGFSSANSTTKHSALKRRQYYNKRLYDVLVNTQVNDCEVMAMGHWHQLLGFRPEPLVRLYDDGEMVQDSWSRIPTVSTEDGERYVHPDNRWYACTGSALKSREQGVTTYPATRGYPPTALGWCVLNYDHEGENLNVEPVAWNG